jgi:hypothetical protein
MIARNAVQFPGEEKETASEIAFTKLQGELGLASSTPVGVVLWLRI